MVFKKILLEEVLSINKINEELLLNLKETPVVLGQRNNDLLRKHFDKQNELSTIQSKQIESIKDIINSTHFKNISQITLHINDDELTKEVIKLKELTYEIVLTSKHNKSLIDECFRITNTQLNILFGQKQEPTNYNFSKKNINEHLFKQLKHN